jgi:hypothetical protein
MKRENDEYEFKERATVEIDTTELQREPLQSIENESVDAENFRRDEAINNR